MIELSVVDGVVQGEIPDDAVRCDIAGPICRVWMPGDDVPAWPVSMAGSAPIVVSPRQLRQALTRAGLRAQVEMAVSQAGQDVQDWWEFAAAFERSHPVLVAMSVQIGFTAAQIDQIFELAATL